METSTILTRMRIGNSKSSLHWIHCLRAAGLGMELPSLDGDLLKNQHHRKRSDQLATGVRCTATSDHGEAASFSAIQQTIIATGATLLLHPRQLSRAGYGVGLGL
ncbi:hypothetical protein PIB30_049434 [Stylosanthes scabra]|uniref:Uncharacterized protein n=1 Tax=Stylosanthes scabra TaxID=79078 RepID=A0ABU6SI15_9FABA|nr:hypothetical protein [Stylosanthes scabra]